MIDGLVCFLTVSTSWLTLTHFSTSSNARSERSPDDSPDSDRKYGDKADRSPRIGQVNVDRTANDSCSSVIADGEEIEVFG